MKSPQFSFICLIKQCRRTMLLPAVLIGSLVFILPCAQAANITLNIQQGSGLDWNTASWSDAQGALTSFNQDNSNTYEILAGKRMRTPNGGNATSFPRNLAVDTSTIPSLTVDGGNSYDSAGNANGEIRFKGNSLQPVYFPNLILNGGQLDSSPASAPNIIPITGNITVTKQSYEYTDGNGTDRGFYFLARLQGSGNLEIHQSTSDGVTTTYLTPGIYVENTNSTYSGNWNVVSGSLVGGGSNSLGSGSISIQNNGAFEAYYDVSNTASALTVNGTGLVYLHQNFYFDHAVIGGVSLAPGTYTAAQLATSFPNNFPATWGRSIMANGNVSPQASSGSLTVYHQNALPISFIIKPANTLALTNQGVTFFATVSNAPTLTLIQWYSNNVAIPNGTNLYYTTPLTTLANNGNAYKLIIANNVNTTNATATLTITNTVVASGFLSDLVWFNHDATAYDQTSVQTTTDAPLLTSYLATFETPNNIGTNFGEKVSGWFTPSVSGNYVFFLASDDGGFLYLSTNNSPANKQLIAQETAYSNPRQWVTSAGGSDTSAKRSDQFGGTTWPGGNTITLTAGTLYYIEADHTQATGGSSLAVTYKMDTDADPVDLAASKFLSGQLSTLAIVGGSSTITNQLQDVTANEDAVTNFTVGVQLNNTASVGYQWYRNGVLIPGATSTAYTTPSLIFNNDNNSHYFLAISVPGAAINYSRTNTLTVIPSTTPAQIAAPPGALQPVGATNQWEVSLVYNKPVNITTATNLGNFVPSAGTVVAVRYLTNAAGFDAAWPASVVTVSNLNLGANYTLAISGIADLHGNILNTNVSFKASRFGWAALGDTNTPFANGGLSFDAIAVGTNGFDLVNAGFDFWDVYTSGSDVGSASDDVTFIYELKTNSFDVIAQVPYMDPAGLVSSAGLMARDSVADLNNNIYTYSPYNLTDVSAPMQTMLVQPPKLYDGTLANNKIAEFGRPTDGALLTDPNNYFAFNAVLGGYPNLPNTNVWVRLKRVVNGTSDVFSMLQSTNGTNWFPYGTRTFNPQLSSVLLVGPVFGAAVSRITGTWANASDWAVRIRFYGDFTYPSFKLTNVTNNAGNVSFSFQTQYALTYTVLFETNLTDAAWQTLQVVSGNSSIKTVTDTNAVTGANTRFYKVMVQ